MRHYEIVTKNIYTVAIAISPTKRACTKETVQVQQTDLLSY